MEFDIDLVRKTVAKDANESELALFLAICKRTGLDPFARQIFFVRRGGVGQTTASVDGFRAVAERSGKYEGQVGPLWCAEDGVWKDVWLGTKPPSAAKVGVYRAGFREALWAVANFDAYNANSPIWRKMPALMLGKCAESLALRRAFPLELSGIYTEDEMGQAQSEPKKLENVQVLSLPENPIVRAFEAIQVKKEQLEHALGKALANWGDEETQKLRKAYAEIRSGANAQAILDALTIEI